MLFDHVTFTLAQDTGTDTPPPPTFTDDVADSATGAGGAPVDASGQPLQQAPPPGGGNMMFFLAIMIGVIFVIMLSSGRRDKKRRAEMLSQIAKGKKVRTIGGILGTVVDVRDNEVHVKVDENANTRLRFTRDAITAVLDEKE